MNSSLIRMDGKTWPTSEHYFQAQKFVGTAHVEALRAAKKGRQLLVFDLGELGHDIYEQGIALAYDRYQQAPKPQWVDLALKFAEGSKAMVLFESQQQLNALHNAGLPDSLKEQEMVLKGDIAFYKNLLENPRLHRNSYLMMPKKLVRNKCVNS